MRKDIALVKQDRMQLEKKKRNKQRIRSMITNLT